MLMFSHFCTAFAVWLRQILFGLVVFSAASLAGTQSAHAACTDPPAPGVDYSGCDLSGADLRSVNLSSADLTSTDLSGADLSGANLYLADLSRARLPGADLSNANLGGATLIAANLRATNLRFARLGYAILIGSDITQADLTSANLNNANLEKVILESAILVGTSLTGAILRYSKLPRANLSGANLSNADLSGSDLSSANMIQVSLRNSLLTGAQLRYVNLNGADLVRVRMRSAGLRNASLIGADLSGADLGSVDLQNARLTGTTLNGAVPFRLTTPNVVVDTDRDSATATVRYPATAILGYHGVVSNRIQFTRANGSAFGVGVTTVTATLTDPNPDLVRTFTVTVNDRQRPVFKGVPANITKATDAGLSTAVVTFTAPTASDNVDGAITPVLVSSPTAGLNSGSAFPLGVTTMTYTATDTAGNAQTASFTVTVRDGEKPVIAGVPANITKATDAGLSTAVVTFTAPTANDNVDGAITPVLVSSPTTGLSSGSAFPVGVTTLTYTATDAAGNAQTASFTVTVGDEEKPVFAGVPANITKDTDAGQSTAVVTFTAPTANDNVDGAITPVFVSSPTAGLNSGSAFPVGVTTLTYTATDAAGNAQTASFAVTVSDNEKPVIAPIADISTTTDAGVSTASTSFATTVSDNVDSAASFTPVFKIGATQITSPHTFPLGVTTVTVSANADSAGNTPDPVSFTVTVRDGEKPVFAGVPANIAQATDAGLTTAVVTFTAPTANDNVDGAITPVLVSSPTAGLDSGSAFPLGVTTMTYTATDAAGNAQTASFTVTVSDNEKPVIAPIADISTTTDAGVSTANVSFATTVSDNVDSAASFTPVFKIGATAITSPHDFPVGVTTVSVSANADTAGNTPDPVSFTVTVGDGEKPVFAGVPADITQATDAGQSTAVVTFTAPTANDNVDGAITPVLVSSPTAGLDSGSAFPLGVTTMTYTATDAAGNAQTASFTVTVSDNEKPVIAPIADISTTTDAGVSTANVSFATTVSDNVDAAASFTPVFKIGATAITSPHDFPVGVTTVSVSANADTAGNTPDPVSFTVTVGDDEAPVFTTFPSNIDLFIDYPATTGVANWVAPSATDNVSGPVTIVQTAGPTSGAAFPIGTTTVTYTATDVAGNITTQSFTVTVTAIPPGTVTFVVNSDVDGTYNIYSAEPVINTAIVTRSGIGRSSVIALRPGSFPITFSAPSGIGVESAQCDVPGSTLNAQTLSGTIVIASGAAVTCTIRTRDSVVETVTQIGAFLEARSQLILQHQPSRARRIDRLEGRVRNNGGISGFGLSFKNARIPFAAQISSDEVSFSYSLRQSRAEGPAPKLTGDITSVLGSFGITPSETNTSPLFPNEVVDADAAKPHSKQIVSRSTSNSAQTAQRAAVNENVPDSNIANEPESHPFDVWAEGKISKFETATGKGNFGIIHIGADYLIKPSVLLGFSVQGDWTNLDGQNGGSRTEGFGFLLTPYLTAKLSDGFYLDARAGWGKAYNDISPFGTYTDSFQSERWIASAALIGTWNLPNGLNITPEARLSYFKEISESYTDSLNVLIPSVEVETGTFEFGPTFSQEFTSRNGSVYSPYLTVQGIWTFTQKNTAADFTNQTNLASEGVRARLEAGLGIQYKNGSSLSLSANYDGIGDNNFKSWGASLQFNHEF